MYKLRASWPSCTNVFFFSSLATPQRVTYALCVPVREHARVPEAEP